MFIKDIALTTSFEYLKYYDILLQQQWMIEKSKDANFPRFAVNINMNDMICQGEEIATNLHEQITASLRAKGLTDHSDMDPEYMEKLLDGFSEGDVEVPADSHC